MTKNSGQRADKTASWLALESAHSEPMVYLSGDGHEMTCARKPVIVETAWPLAVNGQYWLTVLCTPTLLDCFVLGFLYNEGLIEGIDEVLDLQIIRWPETLIEVQLASHNLRLPERRTLTSGCGGGITYVDLAAARRPVTSAMRVSPSQITGLMSDLMATVAGEYHQVGGFHTAGLSDGRQWLAVATDIGRHNTLDKVAGVCLQRRVLLRDTILLTTGRVSVEMLGKAARMQVPVVATINSPTHLAVELARQWSITLVGYVRGSRLQVYSSLERISLPEPAVHEPRLGAAAA